MQGDADEKSQRFGHATGRVQSMLPCDHVPRRRRPPVVDVYELWDEQRRRRSRDPGSDTDSRDRTRRLARRRRPVHSLKHGRTLETASNSRQQPRIFLHRRIVSSAAVSPPSRTHLWRRYRGAENNMTVTKVQSFWKGVCRTCGRTTRLCIAGTLHSWTCTNCGTNNVVPRGSTDVHSCVEERNVTRIPVDENESTPYGEDLSIH